MNRQKFQKSLLNLRGWRERAFILALAERALPNALLYFASVQQVPLAPTQYPYGLPQLLELTWKYLIFEPDEEQLVTLLDAVVGCMPDPEQTDLYGARLTADCLSLLEQALLAGLNDDKKRALEASQFSVGTITQFIEFSEGQDLDDNQLVKLFDQHPLVAREFSWQMELADSLRAATHPGSDSVAALRTLAQDEGVSNIGISLS